MDQLAHAGSRPNLAGTVGGCHGLLQGWLLADILGGEVPMKVAWAMPIHCSETHSPAINLQTCAFGTPPKIAVNPKQWPNAIDAYGELKANSNKIPFAGGVQF